jgi:hypothetical protein
MLVLAKEYQESGVTVFAYNPSMMTIDLPTSVSADKGYEDKLKVFLAIIRMWVKPPAVPAKRIVTLASAQTGGRTGKVVKEMNALGMLWSAVREGARCLFGSAGRGPEIEIDTVPSAFSVEWSNQREEGTQ